MPKTKRMNSKNGTRKNRNGSLQKFEQEVVVKFLEVLTAIKLYHWKTHSYATHKATDDLNANLHKNVDSFVEVLLGKRGDRVNLTNKKYLQRFKITKIFLVSKEDPIPKFLKIRFTILNQATFKTSQANSQLSSKIQKHIKAT